MRRRCDEAGTRASGGRGREQADGPCVWWRDRGRGCVRGEDVGRHRARRRTGAEKAHVTVTALSKGREGKAGKEGRRKGTRPDAGGERRGKEGRRKVPEPVPDSVFESERAREGEGREGGAGLKLVGGHVTGRRPRYQ